MEHVVFYTDPEGRPAFARADSLSEAVSCVEQLRNSNGVQDAAVFAMSSVPVTFSPYFRADVPAEAYDAVPATHEPVVIAVAEAPSEAPEDALPEPLALVPDLAPDSIPGPRLDPHTPHVADLEPIALAPEPIALAPALAPEPLALAPALAPISSATAGSVAAPIDFAPAEQTDEAQSPESGLSAFAHVTAVPDLPAPLGFEPIAFVPDAPTPAEAEQLVDLRVPTVVDDGRALATVLQLHPVVTPAEETPVDETTVDETSVDETPVDETSVDETPVDETPVDEDDLDEPAMDVVDSEHDSSSAEPDEIEAASDPADSIDVGAEEDTGASEGVDHLGALAELAAQVAEETAGDDVDDEAVPVRHAPDAIASDVDTDVNPHDTPPPIDIDLTTHDATAADDEIAVIDLEAEREPAAAATESVAPAAEAPEEAAVASEEPADVVEPVAESVNEQAAEPVAESVDESVAESVQEPVEDPVDVPVAEPVAESVDEPVQESSATAAPDVDLEPSAGGDDAPEADASDASDASDAPAAAAAAIAHDIAPITDEELARVADVPLLPVARSVSPEAPARREGARSLGFFAR